MAHLNTIIDHILDDDYLRSSIVFGKLSEIDLYTTTDLLREQGLEVSPYQIIHAMQTLLGGEVGGIYQSILHTLNKDLPSI
jgi:hypothetical protein